MDAARAGRRRDRGQGAGRPAGPAAGALAGPGLGTLGLQRLDDAATDDARGMLAAGRTGLHARRARRRAPRRRPHPVRDLLRAGRPDGRVRRHRLRRRRRPGRRVPRLPGDRLRRPADLRDAERFPDAARGHRRVAAPVSAGRGRRRPDRRAHRPVRADPRPEVRRPAAGGRSAHAGRLRRRDGFAAHPRGALGPARRGRAVEGGDRPAVLADRARPGRPYAGGDRGLHRRGDHRRPLGRHRASGWPAPTARSTRPPTVEAQQGELPWSRGGS